jgi:hypothetical protein
VKASSLAIHDLLFDPEDGSNMFLQNIGKLLLDYTASYLEDSIITDKS